MHLPSHSVLVNEGHCEAQTDFVLANHHNLYNDDSQNNMNYIKKVENETINASGSAQTFTQDFCVIRHFLNHLLYTVYNPGSQSAPVN